MGNLKLYLNPVVNWLVTSILLSLLLSGCAIMGKDECLNAQWQNVGYEDGTKGYTASRISEYRKSCAEYNVSPDLGAYMKGRQHGLAEWCTPSNGYYQGTIGATYNGVCPETLEAGFQSAMYEGRAVYNYRKRVHDHEMLVARLLREHASIEKEIYYMEAELINAHTRPQRRRFLLNEIRAAERDRDLLRRDISEADFALDEMRRNQHSMETEMTNY